MKFLTRLGQILLRATEIVAGFSSTAALILPGQTEAILTVSADLAQIADIIVNVEVAGQAIGAAGPQKLQMAAAQVAQIILKSAVLVHHDIANPDLFKEGSTDIASGMAKILNSLKDKVESTNKA